MYSGYDRYCILYRAQLDEGQLRLMTTLTNSSVMSIRNKTTLGKQSRIQSFYTRGQTFDDIDSTTSQLQTTPVTTAAMTTAVVSTYIDYP